MKKPMLLLVSLFFIASCQKPKDWDCTCEYTNLGGSGTKSKEIINEKKRNANDECIEYGKRLINGNGKYKCKITEL